MQIECVECKAKAGFTLTIVDLGRRGRTEGERTSPMVGQACQITVTCACGEFFMFNVVVPAHTRWSRELAAVRAIAEAKKGD